MTSDALYHDIIDRKQSQRFLHLATLEPQKGFPAVKALINVWSSSSEETTPIRAPKSLSVLT